MEQPQREDATKWNSPRGSVELNGTTPEGSRMQLNGITQRGCGIEKNSPRGRMQLNGTVQREDTTKWNSPRGRMQLN